MSPQKTALAQMQAIKPSAQRKARVLSEFKACWCLNSNKHAMLDLSLVPCFLVLVATVRMMLCLSK
jgi:hypothetical protein